MGFFSSTKSTFAWIDLEGEQQLDELINRSVEKPILIFKHSTRCSISSFALKNFENDWDEKANCECYFLDLLQYRNVSNYIAETLHVEHQSPQAILLINKEVVYHASHQKIDAQDILKLI